MVIIVRNIKNIFWVSSYILIGVLVIAIYMNFNRDSEYIIELERFGIITNSNAAETTKGINDALVFAKEHGYKKVRLPEGKYLIDTSIITPIKLTDGNNEWIHNRKGIVMQSDIEFIIDGSVLEMIPTDDPYYSIITISDCKNSKITGGTILGDRNTHDYGHIINDNGSELEIGTIDEIIGENIEDDNMVRTKDFIDNFKGEDLPNEFILICLENTTKNTTDGGVRYIYCYDENEKYLGLAISEGYNSFWEKAKLIEGTKKIKVTFKDEKRLDAKYYITTDFTYPSHEFATGISMTSSSDIELNGVTIKNIVGDCVQTFAPPLEVSVDNLKLIDCTFENSRRQGISFVSNGENYLIKGCNIGNINGVDPQSGIDIEHYGYVKNIVIDKCNFYDNKKLDIINYNGSDIEVKNSNFTGGIGVTYGSNMNIHNNKFIYSDPEGVDKIHKGWAIAPNKVEGDYFYITNNYFEGYNIGGVGVQSSSIKNSLFIENEVIDSICMISGDAYNNKYRNCDVRYIYPNKFKNETLINSMLTGENNGEKNIDRIYSNFTLINTTFFGGNDSYRSTILEECTIYSNEKIFCNTWAGSYTVKDSTITTEYKSEIPFIQEQGCDEVLFLRCDMNLSCTPFVKANYKKFTIDNCKIVFNDSYETTETINIFHKGNFMNSEFYKEFDYPKINITIFDESSIDNVVFNGKISNKLELINR